jgi:hypothetical protein
MCSVDFLYDECCESLLHHYSKQKGQDVSSGQKHEETITQNEYLIEYVVSSLGIVETILFPSKYAFESIKEISTQETCRQMLGIFVALGIFVEHSFTDEQLSHMSFFF